MVLTCYRQLSRAPSKGNDGLHVLRLVSFRRFSCSIIPMSVICEKYSVMRDLRCFALKANDVTCRAFSSPFYELILSGGFIRLPSLCAGQCGITCAAILLAAQRLGLQNRSAVSARTQPASRILVGLGAMKNHDACFRLLTRTIIMGKLPAVQVREN